MSKELVRPLKDACSTSLRRVAEAFRAEQPLPGDTQDDSKQNIRSLHKKTAANQQKLTATTQKIVIKNGSK